MPLERPLRARRACGSALPDKGHHIGHNSSWQNNRRRGNSATGHSRRFCDACFSVRHPQYRTFSRPVRTGCAPEPAPELQTRALPRQLMMIALIAFKGACRSPKSPHIDGHQTSPESALAMLFPIFASSQFVEGQRTTDEARDVDRLHCRRKKEIGVRSCQLRKLGFGIVQRLQDITCSEPLPWDGRNKRVGVHRSTIARKRGFGGRGSLPWRRSARHGR